MGKLLLHTADSDYIQNINTFSNRSHSLECSQRDSCASIAATMAAALSHKLLLCILGADYKCKDSSGMCALDYILDYEEWMDCSHFNDDMRARLKGENYCVDASCPIQYRCL